MYHKSNAGCVVDYPNMVNDKKMITSDWQNSVCNHGTPVTEIIVAGKVTLKHVHYLSICVIVQRVPLNQIIYIFCDTQVLKKGCNNAFGIT